MADKMISPEKLVAFLQEKLSTCQAEQSDAMYNVGVFDGKMAVYKELIDKTKSDVNSLGAPSETDGIGRDLYKKVLEIGKAGRVIEAIKTLRAETEWGLKESKDYVEKMLAKEM